MSGGGAGQVYLGPALARVFDQAQKIAEKAGDSYVTVERLLLALALEKDSEAEDPRALWRHPAEPQFRDQRLAQGADRRYRLGRERLRRAQRYARDLTQAARDSKIDP